MAEITAAKVKELRESTGAGMMDAKNALVESDGDMEAAIDYLRKKGLSKAAKKSSRTAAEGLIGLATSDKAGAMVEVNAETDFVARNEQFKEFVRKVTDIALSNAETMEELVAADYDGKNVEEALTDKIATIGENMSLRRMAKLQVNNGTVSGYIHNAMGEGLGKIGVLVALESEGDKDKLDALGKQIAMHVAAAFPQYLRPEEVDQEALDKERQVLSDQARQSGKPEEIIEKMVEGRLRKFYEEVCLLEQVFVIDNETKISKVIENAASEIGDPVELTGFVRFQLGEGIEKEEENFAEEVTKAANG